MGKVNDEQLNAIFDGEDKTNLRNAVMILERIIDANCDYPLIVGVNQTVVKNIQDAVALIEKVRLKDE